MSTSELMGKFINMLLYIYISVEQLPSLRIIGLVRDLVVEQTDTNKRPGVTGSKTSWDILPIC
jgi:hypothetical protein